MTTKKNIGSASSTLLPVKSLPVKSLPVKSLSLLALCLLALPLGGCNGAFVGNFFVLFVSMGIFFGTLNLGRFSPNAPRTPTKGSSATESSS